MPAESGIGQTGNRRVTVPRYHPSMRVILFGASGMVGQGVLRECLRDPDVETILVIGRSPIAPQHPKIRQIARPDPGDLAPVQNELTGFAAAFFCLGVSSATLISPLSFLSLVFFLPLPPPSFFFLSVGGGGCGPRPPLFGGFGPR